MIDNERYKIINGNSLEVLDTLPENSIDSIITDPPYELGFMGKKWDSSGIAYNVELWKKALRVLKPGGFLLAFGGTRTYHRIACAIEDAGFYIKDCIMWLYGSGFPKSMALDKAIEGKLLNGSANPKDFKKLDGEKAESGNWGLNKSVAEQGYRPSDYSADKHLRTVKVNHQTEEGKKWLGWGTCLKPAYEPIIVAQKPVEKTITDNVLKYGVGGINIDECRVGDETIKGGTMPDLQYIGQEQKKQGNGHIMSFGQVENAPRLKCDDHNGRFPANIILTYDETDEKEVCGSMPYTKSTGGTGEASTTKCFNNVKCGSMQNTGANLGGLGDEGSAARYFYCAKASKKDRDSGLIEFESKIVNDGRKTAIDNAFQRGETLRKNIHPTVKPVELMQYLVRLVNPKGATILDIFNGSGSTGKAVAFENRERNADYKYIGIELDSTYCEISKGRIDYAINKFQYDVLEEIEENKKKGQLSLFDDYDL